MTRKRSLRFQPPPQLVEWYARAAQRLQNTGTSEGRTNKRLWQPERDPTETTAVHRDYCCPQWRWVVHPAPYILHAPHLLLRPILQMVV